MVADCSKESQPCCGIEVMEPHGHCAGRQKTQSDNYRADPPRAFDLPPHDDAADAPEDHSNRHRVDSQRPERSAVPGGRLTMRRMHSQKEMTQRHAVFSCEAINVDMPVFQDIRDSGGLIIHGGQEVQLGPAEWLWLFALQ